jgi:hypothetical protein
MGWSTKTIKLFRGTVPLNPTTEDIFLLWNAHKKENVVRGISQLAYRHAERGGKLGRQFAKKCGRDPATKHIWHYHGREGAICY